MWLFTFVDASLGHLCDSTAFLFILMNRTSEKNANTETASDRVASLKQIYTAPCVAREPDARLSKMNDGQ